jgi:ribosome recycling factor
MSQHIPKQAEERMDKSVHALRKDLATLRTGRASPAILDRLVVDYYGTPTPVHQVATIQVPDARTLLIQPWDAQLTSVIEKAIMKSDLGLTPQHDGQSIRLSIPALTTERRAELIKMTKKFGEEAKVAIRNIRRDANDDIKKHNKDSGSEDVAKRLQDEVQKMTDRFIQEVDKCIVQKEKEMSEL